ncbi:DNA integrity scanning diadenylate cyclase DisA [Candidatus Dependentiae bacterium]|nr:DNA integrity scanning diadenylate cyclase DisA [Candidatus Dependentiae bacterium]
MEIKTKKDYQEELIRNKKFLGAMEKLAPGTNLREGIDYIVQAGTGGLIILGYPDNQKNLFEIGFKIESDFISFKLYELAKMDGGIVINKDATKILYGNTHFHPSIAIPSQETGTRHRVAERMAKQTGELVIAISQKRHLVTIYLDNIRYTLKDLPELLSEAQQAMQTYENYKKKLHEKLYELSVMEFKDMTTFQDVTTTIARYMRLKLVEKEVERYILELGIEGRLLRMRLREQVSETIESSFLAMDFCAANKLSKLNKIEEALDFLAYSGQLNNVSIAEALGFEITLKQLEDPISSRAYRIMSKIQKLSPQIIDNIVKTFSSLPKLLSASIDELTKIEGIGDVRATMIKEGLQKLKNQYLFDTHRGY